MSIFHVYMCVGEICERGVQNTYRLSPDSGLAMGTSLSIRSLQKSSNCNIRVCHVLSIL